MKIATIKRKFLVFRQYAQKSRLRDGKSSVCFVDNLYPDPSIENDIL